MEVILAASQHASFIDRVVTHPYRAGATLLALILVGAIMINATNKVLGAAAGIGSAWLTWQLFNVISQDPTPLIVGEPSLTSIFKFFVGTPLQIIVAFFAAGVAAIVWIHGKKNAQQEGSTIPVRIMATVGSFIGILLLFNLGYAIYLHIQG